LSTKHGPTATWPLTTPGCGQSKSRHSFPAVNRMHHLLRPDHPLCDGVPRKNLAGAGAVPSHVESAPGSAFRFGQPRQPGPGGFCYDRRRRGARKGGHADAQARWACVCARSAVPRHCRKLRARASSIQNVYTCPARRARAITNPQHPWRAHRSRSCACPTTRDQHPECVCNAHGGSNPKRGRAKRGL
jgi:hypothetical protein